ncbi:MAG: hypothetical protein EA426_19880 [Spirochaetaceae bacterium]|nr:MAG: hypothetical protein EA426_19880 [Spirochaetaceae bacterium]
MCLKSSFFGYLSGTGAVQPVRVTVFVLLVTLLFFSCGELSMFEVLESEEPGSLTVAQSNVTLPPRAQFQVSATGGFTPYTYELAEGMSAGTIDPTTGLYSAPGAATTDEVVVIDRYGAHVTTFMHVYDQLRVVPSSFSISVGETRMISVHGGRGALALVTEETRGDAEWYPGPGDPIGSPAEVLYTAPTDPGDNGDVFGVQDGAGNLATVTVNVYSAETLRFASAVEVIQAGDSIELTVHGGKVPFEFDIAPPYNKTDHLDPGATSVVFNHPGTPLDAAVLTVTDDGAEASVTVYVVEAELLPLAISPSSLQVTDGTTIEFTASGGVRPYTFERVGPGSGQPVKIDEVTARYTVSFPPGTAQIRLTDATGESVTAKIDVTR